MVSILEEIETYAHKFNIPIMMKDGINFMTNYIKENNIENILEIGTAIGYSAICMCLVNENIKVTTIDRDLERLEKAKENIKKFNLENRITVIYGDALTLDIDGTFDLIFIDAAKSQYIKFFQKYTKQLKINGVVFSDNLNFHGLTKTTEYIESRNVRGIVRKLNSYIDYLKQLPNFETTFYDVGDGISISKKINES